MQKIFDPNYGQVGTRHKERPLPSILFRAGGMETKIQNPFETLCAQLSRIEALVLELKTEIANRKSTGEHSDEGVCLAMHVTGLAKKTIYNLVSRKKIPHYKKGGRLYFDKQELIEWKRSGKHLALNEIDRDSLDQFPLRRTIRGKQSPTM